MSRFVQLMIAACLSAVIAWPVSAGPTPELLATSPQGFTFKLSDRVVDADSRIEHLETRNAQLGNPVNVRAYVLDFRHMVTTGRQFTWHRARYETDRAEIVWPHDQLPTIAFSDGSHLRSAQMMAVSPGHERTPMFLGRSAQTFDPSDLRRVEGHSKATLVFVGFPIGHKVRRSDGKMVDWTLKDIVRTTFETSATAATSALTSDKRR